MSNPQSARILRFDGARNVRDLGGIPLPDGGQTRFGVMYRADGLSRLSDADLTRLSALGIRTVVDLRYDEERARAPDRLPAENPPAVYERGFLPRGSVEMFAGLNEQGADAAEAFRLMQHNYRRIPHEHREEFRDLMHFLVKADTAPHLIHCTSGKDRTGLLAAFVLRALGAAVDDVVADYELSTVEHQPVDAFGPRADPQAVATVMAAHAEYILAALAAIDSRYGSFDAYLRDALGFGTAERDTLSALLRE